MNRSATSMYLHSLILITLITLGFPCFAAETASSEKIEITPATNNVQHAFYYVSVKRKIESLGTASFPTKDGKKMYGKLVVRIPVTYNGIIFEAEGGVKIEESSGNKDLDEAAMQIVRKAAPFDVFPKKPAKVAPRKIWEFVFPFNFTGEKETYNSTIDSNASRQSF